LSTGTGFRSARARSTSSTRPATRRAACRSGWRRRGDVLFSGDTLFRRSIGRTDLWGGSQEQILESIKRELLTLPGGLRVVPGHGPETTIAEEGRRNPFVGNAGYKPA